MTENEIGTAIIECAIEVHRELGPGLLETVYEVALSYLLKERGLPNERQVPIPIAFRGIKFDEGFRADRIVCERVIVELKSKTTINPADRKQIQTHLKLTGLKLSYLLNFGEALLKDGIVRAVNGLEENLCAPASPREKNKFQPDSGINSVTRSALHSVIHFDVGQKMNVAENIKVFSVAECQQSFASDLTGFFFMLLMATSQFIFTFCVMTTWSSFGLNQFVWQ